MMINLNFGKKSTWNEGESIHDDMRLFLIKLLFKLNIASLLKELHLYEKRYKWFSNVNSRTRKYFAEASVVNMQNDSNKIRIGSDTFIRGHIKVLKYGGEVLIGDRSYVGIGTQIWSGERVKIGNHVLISDNVFICDTNSHEINYLERERTYACMIEKGPPLKKGNIETSAVQIKDNAWISYGAIILKGVTIGKGAIVAAGSVVTRNVPDFTLVAGNPARILRRLNDR